MCYAGLRRRFSWVFASCVAMPLTPSRTDTRFRNQEAHHVYRQQQTTLTFSSIGTESAACEDGSEAHPTHHRDFQPAAGVNSHHRSVVAKRKVGVVGFNNQALNW